MNGHRICLTCSVAGLIALTGCAGGTLQSGPADCFERCDAQFLECRASSQFSRLTCIDANAVETMNVVCEDRFMNARSVCAVSATTCRAECP